jgi:nucleoside-diphosphate-sugar epimerase
MRVLITGGAGFKGCVLAEMLMSAGHSVTIFDILSYGEAPVIGLQRLGVRVVRGDVTDDVAVKTEIGRHDAVIHLAALVGFPLCDLDPIRAESVNVGGTQCVVSALEPGQPLVYGSTGSVYGRVDDVCHEDAEARPLTRYGRTKLAGEKMTLASGGAVLRFATVVGVSPCMRFDLMVNAFVYRAVRFGRLDVYQPHDRRSFIDVFDAAAAYCFALEHFSQMSGGVFNVGSPELNLTKSEVARAVARQFPMQIEESSDHPDPDQRDYVVAFDRLRSLGYRTTVDLDTSISQVGAVARLVDNPQQWRFAL